MINKFEKQLEKWNGGVLRGAQAKLARLLRVSTATVALWATGKRRPSKGYAAQMAQLFGLDAYDVMRLFAPTTTYPDLQPRHAPLSLRDAQSPENTYSADNKPEEEGASNSVSLPLLARVPEAYPAYDESDVVEWWTLPRRAARGAKYLVRDAQTPQRDDLYLIKPAGELIDGAVMLVRAGGGHLIARVRQERESVVLHPQDGGRPQAFPAGGVQAVGAAVRKITDAK